MKPISQDPWYSRGYLRHFDSERSVQFVTFRLADSMPQPFYKGGSRNLKWTKLPIDFRKRVEMYLDQSYGSCWLRDKRIASIVCETLFKFDKVRYDLIAWVIMPNHVTF